MRTKSLGAADVANLQAAADTVFTGKVNGLDLRIEPLGPRRRIVISHGERPMFLVSIRPEGLGAALQRGLGGGREIEVGDPAFDAAFYIGGLPKRVHALFDAATRRRSWSWQPWVLSRFTTERCNSTR